KAGARWGPSAHRRQPLAEWIGCGRPAGLHVGVASPALLSAPPRLVSLPLCPCGSVVFCRSLHHSALIIQNSSSLQVLTRMIPIPLLVHEPLRQPRPAP